VRLRSSGVDLVFYNTPRWRTFPRPFLRNHRKLLVTDNTKGFTGGTGLADMFSPAVRPDDYWMDCIVEIAGPVLDDWYRLFAATWRRSARRALDVQWHAAPAQTPAGRGCVVAGSGLGTNEIGHSVAKRVRNAGTRVWVATAYFWPSNRLRRALRRAARRGVDVRLLLPGPYTDAPAARAAARLFYGRLLSSGVVIYEYQPRFLHTKLVLCDDWVSMGSSNLDQWGVLWNLEANQEIESAAFAREVETMLVQSSERSVTLRAASEVEHNWSVPLWRLIAKAVLAWSMRAVLRLRR
jgi:cardiolipin synthase A/B